MLCRHASCLMAFLEPLPVQAWLAVGMPTSTWLSAHARARSE